MPTCTTTKKRDMPGGRTPCSLSHVQNSSHHPLHVRTTSIREARAPVNAREKSIMAIDTPHKRGHPSMTSDTDSSNPKNPSHTGTKRKSNDFSCLGTRIPETVAKIGSVTFSEGSSIIINNELPSEKVTILIFATVSGIRVPRREKSLLFHLVPLWLGFFALSMSLKMMLGNHAFRTSIGNTVSRCTCN